MERDFLEPEQAHQLKKFSEIMAVQGKMTRHLDDAWIGLQMALCKVSEPVVPVTAKHNIVLFGDETWCYIAVRHMGHELPEDNGLCCLRIDRKFLFSQFAPGGFPCKEKMEVIVRCLLAILNVNPVEVDLDKLCRMDSSLN